MVVGVVMDNVWTLEVLKSKEIPKSGEQPDQSNILKPEGKSLTSKSRGHHTPLWSSEGPRAVLAFCQNPKNLTQPHQALCSLQGQKSECSSIKTYSGSYCSLKKALDDEKLQ